MNTKWQKKALCEVLRASRTALRNWYCEGAPLNADLAGDPVLVIPWYLNRPIFSLQWSAMWRIDHYPSIARKILRERRKVAAALKQEQELNSGSASGEPRPRGRKDPA